MPYLLSVFIDTDDDALIQFEGNLYCFYGEDLDINRTFDTVEECYAFLQTKIEIMPGFKVSECLEDWIETFIDHHKAGKDWYGIHGNQTVEISIDEVVPRSTTPPIAEIFAEFEDLAKYLEDGDFGVSHKVDDLRQLVSKLKTKLRFDRLLPEFVFLLFPLFNP